MGFMSAIEDLLVRVEDIVRKAIRDELRSFAGNADMNVGVEGETVPGSRVEVVTRANVEGVAPAVAPPEDPRLNCYQCRNHLPCGAHGSNTGTPA